MSKYLDKMQILGEKFQETKDHKDFEELYNLSFPYYRGICYRYYLQDKHKIEDILSQFYSNVFEKIDQYDKSRGPFTGWIGAIFTNEVMHCFYKNKRLFYFENIFSGFNEEEFDFIKEEEALIKKQKLNNIKNTINNLDEPASTTLKEKYYNNLKLKEISKKYNVTEQIVKNNLFGALKTLRKTLKDPNFKKQRPTRFNKLNNAIKQYKRIKMLEDLNKEELIKIIIELEEQIKVFVFNDKMYKEEIKRLIKKYPNKSRAVRALWKRRKENGKNYL